LQNLSLSRAETVYADSQELINEFGEKIASHHFNFADSQIKTRNQKIK
jgi:hypothetical protein